MIVYIIQYMCGFLSFFLFTSVEKGMTSINGDRVDGYPFVRGLPHTKHKHESASGPTI